MRKLLITVSSLVMVVLVCLGAASIDYNTYMNNAIVYTNVMAKTATFTNGITAGASTFTGTVTAPLLEVGVLSVSNMVASVVPVFNAATNMVPSQTTTNELDYVHGVTSAIQTQLNAKFPSSGGTVSGAVTISQGATNGLTITNTADKVGLAVQGFAGQTNALVSFGSGGTNNINIYNAGLAGKILPATDGDSEIGSSALRFRNIYAFAGVFTGISSSGPMMDSSSVRAADGGFFYWNSRGGITAPSDGVIKFGNNAGTSFNRIQMGGTTTNFMSLVLTTNAPGLPYFSAMDATATTTRPILQKLFVDSKSTNYTVLDGSSFKLFTNEGATGMVTNTLPSAVAGLTYTFVVQDGDGMMVLATGSNTIRIAASVTGAAGNISSSTIGNTVTLAAINTTEWVAIAHEGTWTVSP